MIKTYNHKGLEAFAQTGNPSKLPVNAKHAPRVKAILVALQAAQKPSDMNVPGWAFKQWSGYTARYAVKVTGNYRIRWDWRDGAAEDVEIGDWH